MKRRHFLGLPASLLALGLGLRPSHGVASEGLALPFESKVWTGESYEGSDVLPVCRIGIGRAGINALNAMSGVGRSGDISIAIDTDAAVLAGCRARRTILVKPLPSSAASGDSGVCLTDLDRQRIVAALGDAPIACLVVGLGGATGTTLAPYIAELVKASGVFCIAFVFTPFAYEVSRRQRAALGVEQLAARVDALAVLPNEELSLRLGENVGMGQAFDYFNGLINQAVVGMQSACLADGLVAFDFEDLRATLGNGRRVYLGVGSADGSCRAQLATERALRSGTLPPDGLSRMEQVMVSIQGDIRTSLAEYRTVMHGIRQFLPPHATVCAGCTFSTHPEAPLVVTVLAG